MRIQGTETGRSFGAAWLSGAILTLGAAGAAVAQSECGTWTPLSLGMDGLGSITEVTDMIVYDDGTGPALYAGGGFLNAGGLEVNHVARWDGSQWSAVGAGLDYGVLAFEVFDDGTGQSLYAGGAFRARNGAAGDYIARWDGVSWQPLSSTVDRNIEALKVFDDGGGLALYAAGSFDAAGGQVANGIAKWDGSTWSPLGDGLPGTIQAMEVYDNGSGPALYTVGNRAPYVHRWDGAQWTELPGLPYQGLDLQVFDGGDGAQLYAAGPSGFVARLDGETWTIIRATVGTGTQVYELAVLNIGSSPALYAGDAKGNVSRWDGAVWTEVPSFNEAVHAMITFDDGTGPSLYAGGRFTSSDGFATSRIAVRREYCPTVRFAGGSLHAQGEAMACSTTSVDEEFSGDPGTTFVETRSSTSATFGDPRDPDYYAQFESIVAASIEPSGSTEVLRVQGSVSVYADIFGSCSSEASGSITTTSAMGDPAPILVTIPTAVDVTIQSMSSGSMSIVELVDSAGDPVTEGRIEAGTYELSVAISESVATTLPFPSGVSATGSVDWSFSFSPTGCRADLDGDGELTLFDFLAFQNAFDAGDPIADFDGDGELTIFDFLAFQNEFDAGCG